MKPVVPVFGQLTDAQLQGWLGALQAKTDCVLFKPLSALNSLEREQTKVAVVANPIMADINQLPNLVWVHSLWAGVEKLIEHFKTTTVQLVRLEDPNLGLVMSEAALTWCLYLSRNMHHYRQSQNAKQWAPLPYTDTRERQIAVLGLGNLGKAIAQRLQANGFNVIGWRRNQTRHESLSCVIGLEALPALLASSDIVINVLPHTPDTQGLLNQQRLGQMKKGAQLINFGRGSALDESALLAALEANLDYAVLDVFEQEPLPKDHLFWGHPKIAVLPHISAPTSQKHASHIVVENLERFIRNGELPNTVDVKRGY